MVELRYYGHSFFKLKDKNVTVLIDPIFDSSKTEFKKQRKIPVLQNDLKNISMILLTSEMLEHFDKEAVQKLALRDNATVIAHDFILRDMDLPRNLKMPVSSNTELFLKGVKIKPTTAHCPKSFCPTGFILDLNGKKIYHAGTTHLLESFSNMGIDVLLLPISSRSMDVIDAVRATKMIKPKTVIPMQYDLFETDKNDPNDLKRRIGESVLNTQTVILSPGKKFIL